MLDIKCLSGAFETSRGSPEPAIEPASVDYAWTELLSVAFPKALQEKFEVSFNVFICHWLPYAALQAACYLFLFCFEILHRHRELKHIQDGSHSGLVGEALSVNFYFINFIVFHIFVYLLVNGHISRNRPKFVINNRRVKFHSL